MFCWGLVPRMVKVLIPWGAYSRKFSEVELKGEALLFGKCLVSVSAVIWDRTDASTILISSKSTWRSDWDFKKPIVESKKKAVSNSCRYILIKFRYRNSKAGTQEYWGHKKDHIYRCIPYFCPESKEIRNVAQAGLLTSYIFHPGLPIYWKQWPLLRWKFDWVTAAGTVLDLHKIPY